MTARNWKIDNGRGRVEVRFGSYTGKAGVIDLGETSEVAFFGKLRDFKDVAAGTIEGQPYQVVKAERSDEAQAPAGMVRLTVTAVTPG
jgi:hypothetical protein